MTDNSDLNVIVERLKGMEEQTKLRFDHVDSNFNHLKESISVASNEVRIKMAELNELRKEVLIDRNQYVRADANDVKLDSIEKTVLAAERRLTIIETRSVVWTSAIAVIFIIIQIAFKFIKF